MKTFKLISLQVVEEDGLVPIVLNEGLVINKESKDRTWLLEAYVSTSYYDYFQTIIEKANYPTLQIVISRRENDPAFFHSHSLTIKKLNAEFMSLLFHGTMKSSNTYAELLLTHLIERGYSGEKLIQKFKEQMKTKPILSLKDPICLGEFVPGFLSSALNKNPRHPPKA